MKSRNPPIAFDCTFALLSRISLQYVSTSYINFDYWLCLTVIEFLFIQALSVSIDARRYSQPEVEQLEIIDKKSAIS